MDLNIPKQKEYLDMDLEININNEVPWVKNVP